MKKHVALLIMPCFLALQGAFAQADAHLKLSTEHPAPGEKITFTYDAAGTPLAGKTGLQAAVYYQDKDFDTYDVALSPDGKLLKGSLEIPATAKAFFIKISANNVVDNNSDKGYLYALYKGDKPVEGAYAAEANVLYSGMGTALGKIKMDKAEAANLYAKEFELYPKNQTDESAYIAFLISNKNMPGAIAKIKELANRGDEKNMVAASGLYARVKMQASADSLKEVIKAKFPNGEITKSEAGLAFSKETDVVKKEALYNAYVKKYPETKDNTKQLDNYRLQLASAYLEKNDMTNYNRLAATIKDKTNLAAPLNNIAWAWVEKNEHLAEAAKLSKQSLDLTTEKMNSGGMPFYTATQVKKMYANTYDTYADTYAYILYKQGNVAEALKVQQSVMDNAKFPDGELTEHYALYLKGTGNNAKAKELIEKAIRDGKATEPMTAALKEIYVKEKGSDKGFDAYFAPMKADADIKAKAALAKEMINETAPAFALKDFEGNTVSLASLKGKTVIVDFWATWCGPCKASFPGMQLAVTKFKDNPNVKFLFIDTWENGTDYVPGVKQFIADKKYTFNVLIDEKGEDGRQSKVVSAYKVSGIPTKFVIDGNGNIRFKKIGFEGSAQALADEISNMVDMAGHPETVTTTERASVTTKSK